MKITSGSIFIYRVYDIAEEVNLEKAKSIVSKLNVSEKVQLSKSTRRTLIVRSAPLHIDYGITSLKIGSHVIQARTEIKIWDYAVASVCFSVPIQSGTSWSDLVEFASLIDQEPDIDNVSRACSQEITRTLREALRRPGEWPIYEDYVIFFLERVEGVIAGADFLRRADIPALIWAESKEMLSDKAKNAILEHSYQYGETDLSVIDWNSAVIYEPSGSLDIPNVIEFALTHLLEMRFYDELLDKKLAVLYDAVEERRTSLFRRRVSSLSSEASSRYIEFSEFLERVENSFKIVGDFYLATIFRATTYRFRFKDWQQNIDRKMNILAQISQLLEGEVNIRRSLWLEIIIVLLIAFEIVSAFLRT